MIIKKEIKKTNKKISHNFYKYYFLSTLFTFGLLVLVFINLGIWENYKKEFFYKIYHNGMSNYKYVPQMFIYGAERRKLTVRLEVMYINRSRAVQKTPIHS